MQHDYSDARHHAEIHSDIIATLMRVMEEFEHDELTAVWIECGLLVKQTLVNHLLEEDMKYRDCLGFPYRLKEGCE